MSSKQNPSTKAGTNKTTVIKIAEKVGEIAGKIANKKDQLVNLAGDAFASVTGAVANVTSAKKKQLPKAAPAKAKRQTPGPAAKKVAATSVTKTAKPAVAEKKALAAKTVTKPAAGKKTLPVTAAKKAAAKKPAASKATPAPKPKPAAARPAAAKKTSKK